MGAVVPLVVKPFVPLISNAVISFPKNWQNAIL
jgi:hypothetical protein